MTEYSIVTNNRFALSFDDEEEDLHEVLEKQVEEKRQKDELAAQQKAAKEQAAKEGKKNDKKNSAKSNANKRVTKSTTKSTTNTINDNSNTQRQGTKPAFKTNSRNDENLPPRLSARANRDGPNVNQNFEKPPQDFDRERRGGFGGRGRGGPRGGGFGGRRREFERHSGSDKTGVKAVEKRDGSGPHNWGDEIQAQLDQPGDQQQDNAEQTENAGENGETSGDEKPKVEEPKEMTLDEWKAAQTKTKVEFKVRKANEGSDSKQWKGTVALQKKKKGDEDSDEYEEYSDEEEEVDITKATLEKLNIQITFADSGRSGGPRGRGGRGGGRGFGGRGRGRGGYDYRRDDDHKSSELRVDDEKDFPSLGSR